MTFAKGPSTNSGPLRGLHTVGWSRRLDCRGDTGEVPRLLRTLWMPETDDLCPRALPELAERLVPWNGVQATFCMRAATPAAVPFLVRLAQDRRTRGRDAGMDLLLRIADAVDEGPRGTCFGEWPGRWFDASAKALATTAVTTWIAALDEDREWNRRRDVLRLLATINRSSDDSLSGLLWAWTQDSGDAQLLSERLICLAYATADPSGEGSSPEAWAVLLKKWLTEPGPPSAAQTADATHTALRHLPGWIDADTVHVLAELVNPVLALRW
ncbi:hypothetical protein ITI46_32595 [Streptomyces oryzae]|uniref:Uncharacterized protein n=1 Tax=Streptomyces oryzae TaxID=1434886 RepID=A0ABS3XM08_9ACTN|nr:hypothetical protein [Streptomyces oryzae]MBO8196345.1 hypothetical protein [Streptomyces oryzae]